jgi:hypothetical protein
LRRVNSGSPANQANIHANLSAEWSSTVGQLINRAPLPPGSHNEKLIAQLTSRRKLNDPRGREKLESKADPASRGVESRIERTH